MMHYAKLIIVAIFGILSGITLMELWTPVCTNILHITSSKTAVLFTALMLLSILITALVLIIKWWRWETNATKPGAR